MKFILLNAALICTTIIGDYLVFQSKYSSSMVFRAFCDTSVHGAIGFISAVVFFNRVDIGTQAYVYNVIFCTIMSSMIDVDHFIVARSIYLKDLTNLKQRGIFHCTTFWTLITIMVLLYSYFIKKINLYLLSYMIIIAYMSHHVRDANRRGFWLYPYGHTNPINKYVYIILILFIPNILASIYPMFKNRFYKEVIFDYRLLV